MFVEAIKKAAKHTRPIHTISKSYKSSDILPGAATIFFVNDEGYAITCKHVIELLIQSPAVASIRKHSASASFKFVPVLS